MTPLDKALEDAKQNQSKGDAFYNLFLDTEVLIPTHDQPTNEDRPRRTQVGETFRPYVIEHDDTPFLPVFDEYDRLLAWAQGHQMTYVQMTAHALIRSSLDPKLHIALNVGTTYTKIFVPEELTWLRNLCETQLPKSFTVPAGTKVQVGVPVDIPKGLEASLRECFMRNTEVETAYLGQVHFMIDGYKPELFLVLKIQEHGSQFLNNIQEDIGVASNRFLRDQNMTLQIYDGKGISSDIVKSVKPFYNKARWRMFQHAPPAGRGEAPRP